MSILNSIDLHEIIQAYSSLGEFKTCRPIVNGHINDTYFVEFYNNDSGNIKYLFQRINTNVFRKPDELMKNIIGITDHLRKKIAENGGDPTRETLTVYPTDDGKNYYTASDGSAWRVYNYVDDTYTLNSIESPRDFRDAAVAFGNFQKLLSDYPIETLYDTIPNFHNTPSRFNDFKIAVERNISGRKNDAKREIDFVLKREEDCSVITDLIGSGDIPLRVTHNDTKLNNVLFDNITGQGICVVDLDTVMPGSSLYDFGDSIRFGANTASEDEKDVSKVSINLDYFAAYVDGYLRTAGNSLTPNEIKYLPFASKLLTLECGMRFLGDFLNGDTYFKTEYADHNLVRARTQFKLVADIEKKFEDMVNIVSDISKKYGLSE